MQQVLLNIDNKELEMRLLKEADRRGRKLANIIIEVLETNFLGKKKSKFQYKKLDPLKHMSKIDYEIDESEDLDNVFPFEEVTDSAAYVRKLRKNAWRRA